VEDRVIMDVVAVTGAEGFIGSHLVEALVRRGRRVRAMALYNMWSSASWLDTLGEDIREQVDVVFGDVGDPASARDLVEGAQVVYHLAAIGSVPYSYRAPRTFVDTSTIGTLHILEAVRGSLGRPARAAGRHHPGPGRPGLAAVPRPGRRRPRPMGGRRCPGRTLTSAPRADGRGSSCPPTSIRPFIPADGSGWLSTRPRSGW
jgi:GDP-mannose 4,6 dehydratase